MDTVFKAVSYRNLLKQSIGTISWNNLSKQSFETIHWNNLSEKSSITEYNHTKHESRTIEQLRPPRCMTSQPHTLHNDQTTKSQRKESWQTHINDTILQLVSNSVVLQHDTIMWHKNCHKHWDKKVVYDLQSHRGFERDLQFMSKNVMKICDFEMYMCHLTFYRMPNKWLHCKALFTGQ